MNRSSAPRSGAGASSIMVIIMIVCMTVFGVLAIVSVRTEQQLSQKTTDTFVTRYEADAQAQRTIARIDEILLQSSSDTLRANIESIEGVTLSVDGTEIRFEQPIDDNISLVVVLGDLRPGAASNRYAILSYRQVNNSAWDPDTGTTIFEG